jgi:hypothetical protein
MKQLGLDHSGFVKKPKKTRKQQFLKDMEKVVPWEVSAAPDRSTLPEGRQWPPVVACGDDATYPHRAEVVRRLRFGNKRSAARCPRPAAFRRTRRDRGQGAGYGHDESVVTRTGRDRARGQGPYHERTQPERERLEGRAGVVFSVEEAGGRRTAGVEAGDQSALVLAAGKGRTSVPRDQAPVRVFEGAVSRTGKIYRTADEFVCAIESVHGEAAVTGLRGDMCAVCMAINVPGTQIEFDPGVLKRYQR